MQRTKIKRLLASQEAIDAVLVKGWVRTRRDAKGFSFLEINDGSCLANLQVIADDNLPNYADIKKISTGAAVSIKGALKKSPGKGQSWELQAQKIIVIGMAPENYPLQKKRHSDEFLRTICHLRPRTNKYGAIFRIRSAIALAAHHFFQSRDFQYIHTPIITGLDCEGAGALFTVTSLNLEKTSITDGKPDFAADFFGRRTNLTVSGQLAVEMFALSLGDVYTFGPTFRAEDSNTRRHAAEFWMIEPEMAFCDLDDNMELAETLIKDLVQHTLEQCEQDLSLFSRFVDKTLLPTLENIVRSDFERIAYRDAVAILQKSGQKFEYSVSFGKDLQSEHERFLTEVHFKKPVIIFDYPKNIKPFYMRLNDDDETVAAMDVLVPRIGEIIGGSQREERLEVLDRRMAEAGLDASAYWWYRDSRKYGSAPHSGFGLGFERLLMLLTGVSNIRDVIPFPRTPNSIEF